MFEKSIVVYASTLALLMCVQPTAFAQSPADISKMDEVALERVSNEKLCFAYALALKTRRPNVPASSEVAKRKLDCTASVQEAVYDCSSISITNPTASPRYDYSVPNDKRDDFTYDIVTYEVKNSSLKPMFFRLVWGKYYTTIQRISASTTTGIDLHVPQQRIRELLIKQNGGRAIKPHVQECRVVPGFGGVPGATVPW